MPNGDPRDGFFYPTLTLMTDSYIILLQVFYLSLLSTVCIVCVWSKIEVLSLPPEEKTCFNQERGNGDFSHVIGQVVLEKCLYGTEIKKLNPTITNLPEPTVKWLNGLIEQTLQESDQSGRDATNNQPDVKLYRGKRQAGRRPPRFRIRKEYRMLSDMERNMFHRAISMLKADTTVLPNKFDALGQLHEASVQRGHYGPNFYPWHRLLLLVVENALREKVPGVTIPYWDSTLDDALLDARSSIIWTAPFMGYGYGYVVDGPFRNWNTPYGQLLRSFGQDGAVFNWTSINSSLSQAHLDNISFPDATPEHNLEEHHVQVHLWVGGFMAPPALAAFDPIFYLLHSYVDLLWELFRNLQRRRGVDPTTDYPMDTNVTGHGYNETAGLGNFLNYHGLSDNFTTNIYKYEIPPTCTRDRPYCGSPYIRCDTKRKEPRCVSASIFDPVRMFTPGGIPMDGSSGIREFRSTRNRKQRYSRHKLDQPQQYINGSIDVHYANTFILDGERDPDKWVYIPVQVKVNQYESALTDSRSKARVYPRCDDNNSDLKIVIISDGFNYHGQYKHVRQLNRTEPEVEFKDWIGVKLPRDRNDTEVIVSAHDSCGRICKPVCPYSSKTEECSGALKITAQNPLDFITHGQKQHLHDSRPIPRSAVINEPKVFLSFTCDSVVTDWIW